MSGKWGGADPSAGTGAVVAGAVVCTVVLQESRRSQSCVRWTGNIWSNGRRMLVFLLRLSKPQVRAHLKVGLLITINNYVITDNNSSISFFFKMYIFLSLSLRKKKLPDAFSLHGSVMRHSLLKGISAQIVSAAVSVCPSTADDL